MAFTRHKKGMVILVLVCLSILCSVLLIGARASGSAKRLALRNGSDTLMLLVELATESGDDYIRAKALFAELLLNYADHMDRRDLHWLLRLPPFWKNDAVQELKSVSKYLQDTAQINTREAIDETKKSISEFLAESNPFTDEALIAFEPEVVSKKIQDTIRVSLEDAHRKVERYADEPRTMDEARAVCMANRKAIVYLYLARFGWQEIVSQETLETFRIDINQTVYYNLLLQQNENSDNQRLLHLYSDSETRRLRLLEAIINNDLHQAQVLLQIALKKAIPDIQFLTETR